MGANAKKKTARHKAQREARLANSNALRAEATAHEVLGRLLGDPRLRSRAAALNIVAAATGAGWLTPEPPDARHESSSWMCEAVERAVERAEEDITAAVARGEDVPADGALYGFLGGFACDSVVGTAEEFTCDRCRKFCPQGEGFRNGHLVVPTPGGRTLLLDFGLCDACYALEAGEIVGEVGRP